VEVGAWVVYARMAINILELRSTDIVVDLMNAPTNTAKSRN
jgi:hypothetical protein